MTRKYRGMRRHARQIRRSGMQPMMIVNSGDDLPEPASVTFVRWLRHYRSELAPLPVAVGVLSIAWWLHLTHPRWWGLVLGIALTAALIIAVFGAKLRIPDVLERLYAATTVLAVGVWTTAATVSGPFVSPLPQALAVASLVLAAPWWTNRRRRAKVRVERTLEAWPDIARAVGLAGSQVMSAAVDVWGWRARFRLARGQTIADVTAKIPAIESGLGTVRNAVRVYPTPDDLANRCELRVLHHDPHADAIPWPGPSVTSISQPIDFGPFEDAEPCRVLLLRRRVLVGGTTGAGKSGWLNVLMGNLVACRDVVIWAIDLKKGMELDPWSSCIGRLATTPEQATALLADTVAVLLARAEYLTAAGRRTWVPSPDMPALIVLIDEYAELSEQAPDAAGYADSIARLGRAVAVTLMAATQRPTQKVMGQGAVRSQMDIRICFRVRERRDVDLILGQGMLNAGWHAHTLNAPGKFLISSPEHDTPKRARAYLVTDEVVTETAARYSTIRPELDQVSRRAIQGTSDGTRVVPNEACAYTHENATMSAEEELLHALRAAPEDGIDIGELMRITGMSRPTLYRYLNQLAKTGRAVQVSRGHWRASTTGEAHYE